ncbi:MAG: hypothetical protein NT175_02690 [Bacteroidetes bacterium]|nr:hypothetical protein [Bacteroidota bacterium]
MKRIIQVILIVLVSIVISFGQAPQSINYQAIIRDSLGLPVSNQLTSLRISILKGSATGTAIYVETHSDSTNSFGMINIAIGGGTVVSGSFSAIDWGSDAYFLKMEVDTTAGMDYILMGITQLLSVPYALYSEKTGDTSMWRKNQSSVYYEEGQVGIGTSEPDSSAILDVTSSTQGYLPPRMTTTERDDIENPAEGLMIYNLDCHCINFFNGVEWVSYGQDPNLDFECGGQLTDVRDDKTYGTVQIGDQCWMAENLNVGTMINGSNNQANNGTIEKYCHNNNPANCATYGGLYQWDEAMQYDTTQGAQGICPNGWHIPTDDEWKVIEGTVDSQYGVGDPIWNNAGWRGFDAGGNLKETGYTHWYSPNTGATNESGFTGLPGGIRINGGIFGNLGYFGYFWSSSQPITYGAWFRGLSGDYFANVYRYGSSEGYGFSVRCLKD